jgi:hypothetical protein
MDGFAENSWYCGDGRICCSMGFELERENAASYVLPSNIYVGVGNRHFFENVEQQK